MGPQLSTAVVPASKESIHRLGFQSLGPWQSLSLSSRAGKPRDSFFLSLIYSLAGFLSEAVRLTDSAVRWCMLDSRLELRLFRNRSGYGV